MKLSNFFKSPSCWVKNKFAVDTEGYDIDMMAWNEDLMKSRKIKAMSLYGALGYFFNYEREPERRSRTINNIRQAISSYTGKNYSIAEFNNLESTKFEDIISVIKISERA